LAYTFCNWMGRARPIQQAKELLRDSMIELTADMEVDPGIYDRAEAKWSRELLFCTEVSQESSK
jgi:hypothetical protein